jgi:hypothetical protein
MNIFTYVDNFLPEDVFNELHNVAVRRYPVIKAAFLKEKYHVDHPIRSTDPQADFGHTTLTEDYLIKYGYAAKTAVDMIYQYLINDLNIINPQFSVIWFAYMDTNKFLHYHTDGAVRGIPENRCITTCLYLHKDWKPEYGGFIESKDGTQFMPAPNRLGVWSRDVPHRVLEIEDKSLDFNRMLMASTWTTDGRNI